MVFWFNPVEQHRYGLNVMATLHLHAATQMSAREVPGCLPDEVIWRTVVWEVACRWLARWRAVTSPVACGSSWWAMGVGASCLTPGLICPHRQCNGHPTFSHGPPTAGLLSQLEVPFRKASARCGRHERMLWPGSGLERLSYIQPGCFSTPHTLPKLAQ